MPTQIFERDGFLGQSSSKIIVGDSDDEFALTASSQGQSSAEFKIKPVKKSTVKRQVQKTPARQAPRKRKVQQQEQHGEALKKILLEFVQGRGLSEETPGW